MHRTVLVLVFAAGALVASRVAEDGRANPVSRESHIALQQVRLRAHFDSVLDELRARDVSRLTADQRAARSELTTWLAEYRNAGRFPLNDRYSDSLTPIFRDASGITCAMAYLIERSGRRDIVDRVASTRNLAYVGELVDDPALVAWLDSVGLDVEEAARVQPAYEGSLESHFYSGATIVLSGVSAATATWNILKPNRAVGLLGMVGGGLAVFVGLNAPNEERTRGTINLITGGMAVLTGIYALEKPRGRSAPVREGATEQERLRLTPVVAIAPSQGSARVGISVSF